MRLAFIADAHANLPALRAALGEIRQAGYDLLYHAGDAIAIGPYPAETLDLLLNTPRIRFLMGNHDAKFVFGLRTPKPPNITHGEIEHQLWTHAQLDPALRAQLATWPYVIETAFEGVKTTLLHYGLQPSRRDWVPAVRGATAADMDAMFAAHDAELVLHGHFHSTSDLTGRCRYVNPGSLGCSGKPIARYCLVEFSQGSYSLELRAAPYDDTGLFQAFEERQVPERQFIYRAFLGRRYPPA
ncbi:MAG: metallophosphoesterase family protein [Chloroflexi bacterium]|nr:metallophosphoesterase family protein [Chloroflexota bacterium]